MNKIEKKIVKTFGNIVSRQVCTNPARVRRLLAAAYGLVGWRNSLLRKSGLEEAYTKMGAALSRLICKSFLHPENSIMVNIFFPCEILHSLDIIPVFPEVLSAYLVNSGCEQVFAEAAENADVPESFCSYHKIMIGFAETGVLPKPLSIVNTTLACDANRLSFRRLAEYYRIPHLVVDVPDKIDREAEHYVAAQLRAVTATLEDSCQRKMNWNRLCEAVSIADRSLKSFRDYLEIRGNCSLPVTMSGELYSLIATHVLLGTPEGEDYFKTLKQVAQTAPPSAGKKRILWLHILPNWQDSMRAVFEQNGRCEIVGCDITYDVLIEMDPRRPYESMARRLLHNINNGGAERRIAAAVFYAKKLRADGVLIFCHWGCKQTMGLSQLAKNTLEAEGFPTLVLDGDGCDSRNVSDGQMVTRVNAFLEQLEGEK
ncbi:MAG: 2-hydroxyacyl-CoA dehydratase [Firmicutes bacterium]|nr:2-hydroxyacyl-CoA dehydratase [Bacillota bacterium]